MHTGPVSPRLRFARFEFVRTSGELYREGTPVHLQEQPSQILAALLERPGELVSRETLRQRLWGSETFVDFEHGLNTAVRKLRQALGDAADAPVFIETLARRGYRFIGQVESMPAVVGAAVPARMGPVRHLPLAAGSSASYGPAGSRLLASSRLRRLSAGGRRVGLPSRHRPRALAASQRTSPSCPFASWPTPAGTHGI